MDENLDGDWSWDAQTKVTAQCLLATLCLSNFFKGCTWDCPASKLQKQDIDVYEVYSLVDEKTQRVNAMRTDIDTEFTTWFEDSKRIADDLDINTKKVNVRISK